MPTIFLNYRRDDTNDPVGRIDDHLVWKFGRERVFRDIDRIPPGRDFRKVLDSEVARCDVLLAVIGEKWLHMVDELGRRRLDNPADFVRIEIESALKRDIPLIPVLVGTARMPRPDDLPESMREMAYRHAVIVRGDPDFRNDLQRLIRSLEDLDATLATRTAAEPVSAPIAPPPAPTPTQIGLAFPDTSSPIALAGHSTPNVASTSTPPAARPLPVTAPTPPGSPVVATSTAPPVSVPPVSVTSSTSPTPSTARFLNLDDAARELGLSSTELLSARERGEIRAFRDGSQWRFKRDDLEQWKRRGGSPPPSDSDVRLTAPPLPAAPLKPSDSGLRLDEEPLDLGGGIGDSDILLTASSPADSGINLSAGETGIRLVSADSGLSLEPDDDSRFELSLEPADSGISLDSDDELTLTPSDDGIDLSAVSQLELPDFEETDFELTLDDDDSGSQVIALDDDDSGSQIISLEDLPPFPVFAPFNVDEARRAQREAVDWTRTTSFAASVPNLDIEIRNALGMRFTMIPPGDYERGSPYSDPDAQPRERPAHSITIERPFYLGTVVVTQAEWKAVLGTEPWKSSRQAPVGSDYPATCVSWHDARKFCKTLGRRDGWTYRLPTEAEWEYACRAGTNTRFCCGDDASKLAAFAWFNPTPSKVEGRTLHPVAQKKPNAFGLFDMHGNVFEWCGDHYDAREYSRHAAGASSNPTGERGSQRVYRGGSWAHGPDRCRSADRGGLAPTTKNAALGFRVVVIV